MDAVKNHFKNNILIYLVLFVCLVIVLISLFITRDDTGEIETAKVDTKYFEVVSLQQALKLFDSVEPVFLVIGYESCSATINYVPYLQIATAKFGFPVYYLELASIDENQTEDLKTFRDKLNIDYNFQGETGKYGQFIESTPSTVIIKNQKQVFGFYGSMNTTTIETIAKKYNLIQNN